MDNEKIINPQKAIVKASLMRMLGWVLMLGTIGLTSCKALSQFIGL